LVSEIAAGTGVGAGAVKAGAGRTHGLLNKAIGPSQAQL
jgi:hypothetical protein